MIQMRGEAYLLSFGGTGNQQGATLRRFLDQVESVTQLELQYSQETAAILDSIDLRWNGEKEIPKEKFLSFVRILLVMNDFTVTAVESEEGGPFVVEALPGNRSSGHARIRSSNLHIAPRD